jgi:hypothetical protein
VPQDRDQNFVIKGTSTREAGSKPRESRVDREQSMSSDSFEFCSAAVLGGHPLYRLLVTSPVAFLSGALLSISSFTPVLIWSVEHQPRVYSPNSWQQ